MRPLTMFRGWSLAGCYAAMFVIGLLLSVYGPIVAVLQGRFEVSDVEVGAALGTQSFGAVLGVLLAQSVLRARGNRFTVMASLWLIAAGVLVIATAQTWALVLTGTAIAGLGFGGVDSIITQLILVGSGTKGPGRTNIAHGWFGIGTVAGPGMIYLVGPGNYPWVFAGAAMVTVLALVSTAGIAARPTPAEFSSQAHLDGDGKGSGLPAMFGCVIAGFFFLYFIHFAVQGGIGNWAPTVMHEQSGLDLQTATLFVSGFWATMVLGRFGAAALAQRVRPGTLVTVSSIGLAATVALTTLSAVSPWAFVIAGVFIGPIFPTGLAWLSQSGYGRGNTIAYVIAGSMLGISIAPSFVGWVIEQQGTHVAPHVLTAMAVLVVFASVALLILPTHAPTQTVRHENEETPQRPAA